jgi:hypothetical protein
MRGTPRAGRSPGPAPPPAAPETQDPVFGDVRVMTVDMATEGVWDGPERLDSLGDLLRQADPGVLCLQGSCAVLNESASRILKILGYSHRSQPSPQYPELIVFSKTPIRTTTWLCEGGMVACEVRHDEILTDATPAGRAPSVEWYWVVTARVPPSSPQRSRYFTELTRLSRDRRVIFAGNTQIRAFEDSRTDAPEAFLDAFEEAGEVNSPHSVSDRSPLAQPGVVSSRPDRIFFDPRYFTMQRYVVCFGEELLRCALSPHDPVCARVEWVL